jgi:glutamate---cysteine ligase / carboxylate-amine ligase
MTQSMSSSLKFAHSEAHTLGVEMELQLIHPETLDLHPFAPELIERWGQRDERVKPELLQSMIEVNTGICRDVHEAERDLRTTTGELFSMCRQIGAAVASNGTHPTARHWDRKLYPAPRYQDLIDRNQFIARRLMIFGLHVHVGARNGEHCIRMNNEFLYYLPHLLALSASSPFWEGEDTGLASSRITAFEALPTGGHPCEVSSWEDYQDLVAKLVRSKAIRDLKDIWWDLRPSPNYGTLEIRVCDGLPTIHETMALTSLIQCLAISFDEKIEAGEPPPRLPTWLIRENKWRASRHGLDADLVFNDMGETRPLREDIELTLKKLQPIADRLGYQYYFLSLRRQLKREPSYKRQKQVYESTGSLKEVTRSLIEEFKDDIESGEYPVPLPTSLAT